MALSKDEVANLRAKAACSGPTDIREIANSHEELRSYCIQLLSHLGECNCGVADTSKKYRDEVISAIDV